MNELKTLKECQAVKINELRAEAIKWVKRFGDTGEDFLEVGGFSAGSWIKHFFNLTEEELK